MCVKSLRLFHITTKAAVTSNTGNKNLATCFTTLLQNELNSDVGRGRTRNIAFQLHGFLLPVLPYLRAKFETELLSFYLVQATRGCWGGGGGGDKHMGWNREQSTQQLTEAKKSYWRVHKLKGNKHPLEKKVEFFVRYTKLR